jgi:hypothetical protein
LPKPLLLNQLHLLLHLLLLLLLLPRKKKPSLLPRLLSLPRSNNHKCENARVLALKNIMKIGAEAPIFVLYVYLINSCT